MDRRDRADETEDGAWRGMLPAWKAPEPPRRLEEALRHKLRQRRRASATRWWALAAALAAVLSGAGVATYEPRPSRAARAMAVAVGDAEVRTEVDLAGFEPVRRPRLQRLHEATSETSLAGFEPVAKMTITRLSPGGRS
jgi:hypothetical protein